MAKREKVSKNERIAQRIANREYNKHDGWWPLRTAILKALDAKDRILARKVKEARKQEREFMSDVGRIVAAKEANKAAWDVKLNQPAESSYEWVAEKYGPRPTRRKKG